MKRLLLILALGLAGGLGSYFGWDYMHRLPADELGAQLAWMKSDLGLSSDQVSRIRALHEQSTPRLLALSAQLASMREEFAAFERERSDTGRIDFIEFARFVEQRRQLDRECALSTRQLIAASADVMTPQQREHYLQLLSPALKSTRTESLN